ncbi:YicC/YloC family endoribonuclease [Ornithobacterium rhinotracheale]|uniref:YicC/YloC family endoribonuclease n=1 Tax=Ornithobacterium rhinotracheale TaxID=28251 RepID=UPI00403572FB
MIQSMTGFGKSKVSFENASYTIDIKSLNSKNLDLNIRLPLDLKDKELEIRKIVSESLNRGKVDVFVNHTHNGVAKTHQLNTPLIKEYIEQFKAIDERLSVDTLFKSAMKMPDVYVQEQTEISEEDWNKFTSELQEALNQLKKFRSDEGKVLAEDFKLRIHEILNLLSQVPNFEHERITNIKERMQKGLNEIKEVDLNRFEQELIFYLEKLDITEEKVRLKNHCEYFLKNIDSSKSNGKKLNFICQEIGREINTLGSKSNHAEMQKLVIKMKDELEKIKEQVLNVL